MGRHPRHAIEIVESDAGGIVHVANIKGGVGKSTVATNLAAALAKRGPTLVVDLDVQGSATVALGIEVGRHAFTSWDFFRKRFAPPGSLPRGAAEAAGNLTAADLLHRVESAAFGWLLGRETLRSLAVRIDTNLDLAPAGVGLFRPVHAHHLVNMSWNLQVCRRTYRYVVLDTPSTWNDLIRLLYRASDVNLIPVTLNALSTKSLRDYLHSVRQLAERHRTIRVRILKNEVFGKVGSKVRGKTRTMNENRAFLERLCEQVLVRSDANLSVVPQAILLDLEIPETAAVRDAQDEGLAVSRTHQYAAVTRAFEQLADELQRVLNNYGARRGPSFWERHMGRAVTAVRAAALLALAFVYSSERPVSGLDAPRPIAPQQVVESPSRVVACTLGGGESLYRLAKYAICRLRAKVASRAELDQYTLETVRTHNLTRMPGEPLIEDLSRTPVGTVLKFYPPTKVANPLERQMVPVYEYFSSLVRDPHPYITGDWCERGEGGGTPHYGIDVAGALGSKVLSPVDGIAVVQHSRSFGRTVGVESGGMIVFFAHLGEVAFSTGDRVRKGAVLGTIGMSGRTSGPHVHIGYGLRSQSGEGTRFGGHNYKLTDPKLFFFREVYMIGLERRG